MGASPLSYHEEHFLLQSVVCLLPPSRPSGPGCCFFHAFFLLSPLSLFFSCDLTLSVRFCSFAVVPLAERLVTLLPHLEGGHSVDPVWFLFDDEGPLQSPRQDVFRMVCLVLISLCAAAAGA